MTDPYREEDYLEERKRNTLAIDAAIKAALVQFNHKCVPEDVVVALTGAIYDVCKANPTTNLLFVEQHLFALRRLIFKDLAPDTHETSGAMN
jgi:hypothetical protein